MRQWLSFNGFGLRTDKQAGVAAAIMAAVLMALAALIFAGDRLPDWLMEGPSPFLTVLVAVILVLPFCLGQSWLPVVKNGPRDMRRTALGAFGLLSLVLTVKTPEPAASVTEAFGQWAFVLVILGFAYGWRSAGFWRVLWRKPVLRRIVLRNSASALWMPVLFGGFVYLYVDTTAAEAVWVALLLIGSAAHGLWFGTLPRAGASPFARSVTVVGEGLSFGLLMTLCFVLIDVLSLRALDWGSVVGPVIGGIVGALVSSGLTAAKRAALVRL